MTNYKETLETKRLLLRALLPEDFEAVHSWAGNPENTRYMSWGPNDEEQTKWFLTNAVNPGRDFAVVLKETGAVIGSCGIYPDDVNYSAELGWILHKDYWKRGYGTELGAELIRYGFEDLKLGRIEAPCAACNYGSYRVMEHNGMRREALRRKAFWARVDKKRIDEAWYGILAEDYLGISIREITPSDYPLLEDFLYSAVYVPDGEDAPPRGIIYEPEIYIYINDFGKSSDTGVAAEKDGAAVGAAWARIIPAFGHIDDSTPELAVSVLPGFRGQGIGTMLMNRLFELLRERGYKRTSLSVQKKNPAVRFYERLGYKITDGQTGRTGHEDYIMVKDLV